MRTLINFGLVLVLSFGSVGCGPPVPQETAERCIGYVQRNLPLSVAMIGIRDSDGLLYAQPFSERNGLRSFHVQYAIRQRDGGLGYYMARCVYRPDEDHVYSVRLHDMDLTDELPPELLPERFISNPAW